MSIGGDYPGGPDPQFGHGLPSPSPTSLGVFELDQQLRVVRADSQAEQALASPGRTLLGSRLEDLFGPLSGELASLQSALKGQGPAIVRCTVSPSAAPLSPMSALFAIERRDGEAISTCVALDRAGEPGAISPDSMRPRRYSGPDRRSSTIDDVLVGSTNTPSVADEIINSLQRFGSRFDFHAMSAIRVVGGQLHRSQLWNPHNPDVAISGPLQPIDIPRAVEKVLQGQASGPQELGTLDPEIVTALLGIPDYAQADLSMMAARLNLPHGQGLLLGALERKGSSQLSLNFNRTLRDLGWLVTQLMARLEADETLTVQLRLQDTLRTIASGFLSIAPGQRSTALRESLWRFGTAVGAERVALWMVQPDTDLLTLSAQYAGGDVLPIARRTLPVDDLADLLPTSHETVVLPGRSLTDLGLHTTRRESAITHRSRVTIVPLYEDDRTLGFMLAVVDRTVSWSAGHTSGLDSFASLLVSFLERIENEERFDRALSDGSFAVTWRKPTGELIRCNQAFLDFIGRDSAYALLGTKLEDLLPDAMSAPPPEQKLLTSGPVEAAFAHGSGSVVWGRLMSFEVRQGSDTVLVSHIEDITDSRKLRAELLHQATHDEMTGLANRRGLLHELDRLMAPDFTADSAAVFLIDVDRFKVVNDSLGHAAGDELLRILAGQLRDSLRPQDVAARLGGDEFIVVLAGPIDDEIVHHAAQELLTRLSGAFDLDGHEVYTTISVGIAFPNPADSSSSDVLRHADAAMYEAKARGRNRFEIFDEDTRDALAVKSSNETELRRALDHGDFVPYFQPEYDLRTREIVGAEALVRWPHPTRGILTADAIVPFAEEAGLIAQLGRLVLDQACAAAAVWSDQLGDRPFTLRVNISATQLANLDIVDDITTALKTHGMKPEDLCLEVTETALMQDPEQAMNILDVLVSEVGVSIAVDDFGTGFSSLAYLRRLPVQSLKIDREFVLGLNDNPENVTIIEAIVALATSLGLELVAEGIEDEETAQRLLEVGVKRGQGFYLARPVDHDRAAELILGADAPVIALNGATGTRSPRR